MRFLLLGSPSDAAADAVVRHGHVARRPADIGLSTSAGIDEVLEAARVQQCELLTDDAALVARVFDLPSRFNRCIVYLQLEGGDVEQDDAIDRLFARYKRLSAGRLYTVTGSRVKVRQLPSPQPERNR